MSHYQRITGIVLFCLLGMPSLASAQFFPFGGISDDAFEEGGEADEIETDRDSFTPATTVVGYHRTVVESAYSFVDNRGVPETHSFPEIVTRFGLTDNIELRVGWNYEVGGAANPISGNVSESPDEEEVGLERESKILYGAKFYLNEQDDWLPESSIIVQGFTPTSGLANDSNFSTTFVSGWVYENGWTWDSALRFSTGSLDEDHFNIWAPSTVLKIPVGERYKAHVEYFGIFTEGRESDSVQHFFSPGIHYLLTPDLEIGVRVGWGLNDQSPNFFTNFGGGVRF